MANLGYSSKLQIVIVPSDQTYASPTGAEMTGKLIFREKDNIIEVNGHKYQASSTSDLGAVIEGLKNTGYLTESGGALVATQNLSTVADLLGDKIKVSGPTGTATVSAWIESLQGNISSIEADITNLQNLTGTGATGTFVERSKNGTDYANTDAIAGAIANAKTTVGATGSYVTVTKTEGSGSTPDSYQVSTTNALTEAIANAKTTIAGATGSYITVTKTPGSGATPDSYTVSTNDTLDTAITTARNDAVSTAKSQLIGTGAIAPAGATGLSNDEVWMHNEEQTLSHLKELINDLGGKDLADVQEAIKAIKNELKTGEGADLAETLIDKLSSFLNSKTEWTVNGATGVHNVEGIIAALEEEISAAADAAKDAHSTVGATGTYITVTSATGAGGGKDYTVASTTALDTAISHAKTTVGATGTYVTVTKTEGTGANPDSYKVSTTDALDTAISHAKTTVGATGSYVTVTKTEGTGANPDSYQVSTTAALNTAIANAKTTVTGGTGTATTKTNYVAVTKNTGAGATGDSYAVSTTAALDTAISAAQTNAENTAKGYADSVISWTVIGAQ